MASASSNVTPRSGATVLVVDDEPDIIELLQCALGGNGFDLVEADDVPSAQQQIAAQRPDVVLLDWMLPTYSGLDFLEQLRRTKSTRGLPVIMLSAKTSDEDRVMALDAGADDYICKPFSTRELRARIQAVLRRSQWTYPEEELGVRRGHLAFDLVERRVWLKDQELRLSPQEFDLLEFLVKHEDKAFSRQQLSDRALGQGRHRSERTIDVHIGRLRKALAIAHGDDLIQTVRGIGYRFSLRKQDSVR